jgi:hypothetical protein
MEGSWNSCTKVSVGEGGGVLHLDVVILFLKMDIYACNCVLAQRFLLVVGVG